MQAKAAPGFARPSWYVLSDLLAAMGVRTNYSLASEVFSAIAAARTEFTGMSYDTLGLRGRAVSGQPATAGASA
jgi:NADH-quinone oxidoreductase subunit G